MKFKNVGKWTTSKNTSRENEKIKGKKELKLCSANTM